MASRRLPSRLRNITGVTHRQLINPNFISPLRHECLIPSRPYSDAPQPPPIDSKPLPTAGDDLLKKKKIASSLNQAELAKFSPISETWWDAEGPFKPLHVMNPTRLAFIRSTLCRHFGKDPYCANPFEGLKFVDVGCGGGILSEVGMKSLHAAQDYPTNDAWAMKQFVGSFSYKIYCRTVDQILFPVHVDGNHWILLRMDLHQHTFYVYNFMDQQGVEAKLEYLVQTMPKILKACDFSSMSICKSPLSRVCHSNKQTAEHATFLC